MGKIYASSRRAILLCLAIFSSVFTENTFAQTYNDGPIELMVRLRDFNLTFSETDIGFFGVVGQPDDLTYYVWARDNADVDGVNWGGGTGCLIEDYDLPLTDFNTTIYTNTYVGTTVPQFVDIRVDLWEDESPDQLLGIGCVGTRCAYDVNFCCGGVVFGTCVGAIDDDDLRCEGDPYATLDYRIGDPCVWYDHGYLSGNCNIAANDVYHPKIETFWRYTRGNDCATPIDLGNVLPGFPTINHYNSNVCYTDDNVYLGGGQDVFYQVNITQPVGLVVNTCGTGSAVTDVLILDASCSPLFSNSAGCGSGATITTPICNPGIYYVVVEGRNNSTGTFTLEISEDPSVIVNADAGPDVSVCAGLGVAIGGAPSATGGQSPYTYSWNNTQWLNAGNIANPIAFPPTTTDFILTVTDNIGCVSMDTVTVVVNSIAPPALGPNQTVCPGVAVTFDAGSSFNTYFWNNGSFTQSVNVTQPGQYVVVVTDLNGCQARDTVELINFNLPAISLGVDTAICNGNNLTLTPGTGFSNYNWSTTAVTQSISVAATGTYSVTIQDANGCTDEDSIDVVVNAIPTVSLGPDVTVCPGDPATFDPGPNYLFYDWTGGSNNQTLTSNTPGNYTVQITDTNGCQNTDDINLFNFPGASPNIVGITQFCDGQNTTLNAGGGYSTYSWNTGAQSQIISAQFPGTYMVTVTDINGCEGADTVVVTTIPAPTVDLGPSDTTLCPGTPTLLTATSPNPGLIYTWSTGPSGPIPTILVSTAGMVYVTATNSSGCTAVDSIDVMIGNSPVPLPLANAAICVGDSIMLDPGPGFNSYAWSTGSSNQTIMVSLPGTYDCTVSNALGCEAVTSMTLSNNPGPSPNLGNNVLACADSVVVLDPGAGFATYNWNTGDMTPTISPSTPGQYTVTVTDANGCEAADTVQLTFVALPTIDIGPADTIGCQGTGVVLSVPINGLSYEWSTGSTAASITVNTPGMVYATVTNGNGCTAVDSIDVSFSPLPVPNALPSPTICIGDSVLLDPGAGFASYAWSTGSSNQTIMVTTPGNYDVTVTNSIGCQEVTSMTLSNYGPVSVSLGPDQTECEGTPVILDAGAGFTGYVWNTGAISQTISVQFPGQYAVTITDANGCEAADTIQINYNPLPVIDLGIDDTLCTGGTTTLDAGPGYGSYLWNTTDVTQSITVGVTGTYSVTVTDAVNGCPNSDDIEVIANTIPPVDLGPDTAFCDSGMVLLDAGPQYVQYQWSPAMSSDQYLIVGMPGPYSVTVTDQYNCVSTDLVNVGVQSLQFQDFLDPTADKCPDVDLLLDAGDQWEYYQWDVGSPDQYLLVDLADVYRIVATDSNGCRYFDSIEVVELTPPTLELGPNLDVCPEEVLLVDAGSGFDSYTWSTGETTQSIEVDAPGSYSVTTTFQICSDEDNVSVGDICPGEVFIPNVFSPNGDDLNDNFELLTQNLGELTVVIYDRWGKFIFESKDKNFKWDGTYKGNPLPEGTYYYIMEYKLLNSEVVEEKKGTIALIR